MSERSPDMTWLSCGDCERDFTLADLERDACPHCGSLNYNDYTSEDK